MVGASPYARKVRVAAAERGLLDGIEIVTANPHQRPPDLVAANPLSKVPTLVADDGSVHIDSLAICLYLDTLGDAPPLVMVEGPQKWTILRRHALAHGVMDSSVIRRMESQLAPEPDRLAWMERQLATTKRTLDWFEERTGEFAGTLTIDTLTLACALGYLDFRFPQDDWRTGRPRLAGWHAEISQRPSLRATEFHA